MNKKGVEKELARGNDISIINLIDEVLLCAEENRSSDIHIVPVADKVRVRFRIDGVLQDAFNFPKIIQSEIVSRIKVLSNLPTDEHQKAQDGRFSHTLIIGEGSIDIRVSIVPTYYGENIVLRLLFDRSEDTTLDSLGFNKSEVAKIAHAIKKPHGMILVTGPTGSGKTTTLYTLIKMLNTKELSIITLEDPIEYAIPDIEQIQVNPRSGLTFATGLRSILRQDPNIIMVGEIRDAETANIAVNTSLTGHLLLSTIHTNDTATTLPRLLDMHIEPYLVASTFSLAIGQRLVRKICEHCKEPFEIGPELEESLKRPALSGLKVKGGTFYRGRGCDECNNSGYMGRICINEILEASDEVRTAIIRKASADEIKNIAIKNGMVPMMKDGMQKAQAGLTTIEEVLRVAYE